MTYYYVRFTCFGPDNKTPKTPENPNPQDKSILWTLLYERGERDGPLACGWISNLHIGLSEIDLEKEYSVNMKEVYYMESENGGRTNTRQYATPEEYWADLVVKELVQRKYREGMDFSFAYNGDPEQMDKIYIFELNCQRFEMKEDLYDFEGKNYAPPIEWYNEVHADKIQELGTKEVFQTAEEAISNVKAADDLFGERYFPVAKAPIDQMDNLIEECNAFKGCSKPLMDDKFVYVGIRSKPYEIGAIENIYALPGGTILKQTEWDW